MEKDGPGKMDRQVKKCSGARKSGRRKNNVGSDKEEEKKFAGPLAKMNSLLKDALEQCRPNLFTCRASYYLVRLLAGHMYSLTNLYKVQYFMKSQS